ncbi:MAG: hypothetical protein MUO70_01560 [Euryarchaeota archaeon]|nr:hypothetical protein [Euryarchaeota archaeon]
MPIGSSGVAKATIMSEPLPPLSYPSQPESAITTRFQYDGNGNLVSRIDGNGNETIFRYDKINRLIEINYPGGESPDVTFTYELKGSLTQTPEIAMSDWTGTTRHIFYGDGKPYLILYPDGSIIVYSYDEESSPNVTLLSYFPPTMDVLDNIIVEYEYDVDNRISKVTNDFTGDVTSYQYDEAGNVKKCILPNDAYTLYSYDLDGRLICVEHRDDSNNLLVKYEYTLIAIGKCTEAVETTPIGSKTTTYTYDTLDRLDTVMFPDGRVMDYNYDTFGNRTKITEIIDGVVTVTEYFYDSDSRLLYTKVNDGMVVRLESL